MHLCCAVLQWPPHASSQALPSPPLPPPPLASATLSLSVLTLATYTPSHTLSPLGCRPVCKLSGACNIQPASPLTWHVGSWQKVMRRLLLNKPWTLLKDGYRDCQDCCHELKWSHGVPLYDRIPFNDRNSVRLLSKDSLYCNEIAFHFLLHVPS